MLCDPYIKIIIAGRILCTRVLFITRIDRNVDFKAGGPI